MKLTSSKALIAGLLLIGSTSFVACENEIDINAEYEDLTIVYGLLDPNDSIHQFKINKLIQNNDGQIIAAQDRAAAEYENLQAELVEERYNDATQEWDTTGVKVPLTETLVTNKEDGLFYYPDQKIYEAELDLNAAYQYRINIYKNEVVPDTVTATTDVISLKQSSSDPNVQTSIDGVASNIGYRFAQFGQNTQDRRIKMTIKAPLNAKSFDVSLAFGYTEVYKDGSPEQKKEISYGLGTFLVDNIATEEVEREEITVEIYSSQFFKFIGDNVSDVTDASNIEKRIPDSVRFSYYTANEILDAYMEVNEPNTSLLEDKPAYSNVEGGIGIFASRTSAGVIAKISQDSMEELVNGVDYGFTGAKGFCYNTKQHPQNTTDDCF